MQRGGVGLGIGSGGSVVGRPVGPVKSVGPGVGGPGEEVEVPDGMSVELTPGNAGADALLEPLLLQRRYR